MVINNSVREFWGKSQEKEVQIERLEGWSGGLGTGLSSNLAKSTKRKCSVRYNMKRASQCFDAFGKWIFLLFK